MTTDETPTPNRDNTVVKNSIPQTETQQSTLPYQELVFCNLVARGYSLTTAYRKAFPAKADRSYDTVRQLAHQLFTKSAISQEVAIKKETMARIARLSEERIEETLIEGKTGSKSLTDTMLAMFNHANGMPKQSVSVSSQCVSVNIDLTSADLTSPDA